MRAFRFKLFLAGLAVYFCFLVGLRNASADVGNEFVEVAKSAVVDVLKLGPGDYVLISSYAHTLDLAEAVAMECLRVRALPLISYDSDVLYGFRLSDAISEDTLRQTPLHLKGLLENISAEIAFAGPAGPAVFAMVSPAKLEAINAGWVPLMGIAEEKKIRGVYIEYRFATPERAKQYGVDYEAWAKSIVSALNVDLDEIASRTEAVSKVIANADEVRITAPNGTEVTFSTSGREAFAYDGSLDEEDIEKGNTWVSLPTGAVSVTILEDSANGKVVRDKVELWVKVVEGLTWEFTEGKMTSFSATANEDLFGDFIGGATGDKDRISFFEIEVNPSAEPMGVGLNDWLGSGVVTIGIGRNIESGGNKETNFSWSIPIHEATVVVDGTVLVENGVLKV